MLRDLRGDDIVKAAVLRTIGQHLSVEDVDVPEPGPGQVRIRMRASGVCGTDIHVWHGHFPVELPLVLGHEPVGVVDAVGPGVTEPTVGDRVGVSWLAARMRALRRVPAAPREVLRGGRSPGRTTAAVTASS